MPDTGAPWNIPYVESADLVSDWPADSLALANAIDAGLDVAGGLVAVTSALKTDTFSASVTAGNNTAITDLSITHTMANASNKLLLIAFVGMAANSGTYNETAIGIADGGTLIGVGATAGSRTEVGAGGIDATNPANYISQPLACHVLYAPGDTSSHTYTLNAINVKTSTATVYINRNVADTDSVGTARSASVLTLLEVRV